MSNKMVDDKPRYQYFYEFINDAVEALNNIQVISIPNTGVKSLFKELKKRKVNLTYGSLRLDRDDNGKVFLKEYRPRRLFPLTGYFYNVKPVYPFWESIGSALIRISKKKNRQKDSNKKNRALFDKILGSVLHSDKEYCLILQGNMEREYVKILLEQGRITYNTKESHIKEEPIFSALTILSQIPREQIVETELVNKKNFNNELVDILKKVGKTIQEIAFVIGKKNEDEFYCALNENTNHFAVNTFNYKLFPFELAKEIILANRDLIYNHRLLVLDSLTFDSIWQFLNNFDKFYVKLS